LIRSGRLYHLPIECKDIERGILRRLCRRLRLAYVPWTLRFYDRLFLREGKSKYNRALIKYCQKHNVETYIVNEGSSVYTHGNIPMRADYFMCEPEQVGKWVEAGIPRGQIITYKHRPKSYPDLLFLAPFYLPDRDFLHPNCWGNRNSLVMRVIEEYLDKPVMFKAHRKNIDICRQFVPSYRLVTGVADDLIVQYRHIYCFSFSSIVEDVRQAGKTPRLVDR